MKRKKEESENAAKCLHGRSTSGRAVVTLSGVPRVSDNRYLTNHLNFTLFAPIGTYILHILSSISSGSGT